MAYDIYSAVGNRIRARLILCLLEKPKNVTELIKNCGLAQSAVSQHLSKLRLAGIVTAEKRGKEIYYTLKKRKAAEASKILHSLEQEVL